MHEELIIVAGHAPFRATVQSVPDQPDADDAWVLQPFQRGEPRLYIEHIRRGVELLANKPEALLIFSGGYTRAEAGPQWSEADTYLAIARHFNWWIANEELRQRLSERIATEDFSRDSFENLLFSICRFQQITNQYPGCVTVISWAFKKARFDLHRSAIRFPSSRFTFDGINNPVDLLAAQKSEAVTYQAFTQNRYGNSGELAVKRQHRNPLNHQHRFDECRGLKDFFQFINAPENGQRDYPRQLPW
jgi:hypothetical protein